MLDIRSVEVRRGGEGNLSLDVLAAGGLIHADVLVTREQAEAIDKLRDGKAEALEKLVQGDVRFTDKAIAEAIAAKEAQDAIDVEMEALAEKMRAVLAEAKPIEPIDVLPIGDIEPIVR